MLKRKKMEGVAKGYIYKIKNWKLTFLEAETILLA